MVKIKSIDWLAEYEEMRGAGFNMEITEHGETFWKKETTHDEVKVKIMELLEKHWLETPQRLMQFLVNYTAWGGKVKDGMVPDPFYVQDEEMLACLLAYELQTDNHKMGIRADSRIEWVCPHGVGHTVWAPSKSDYAHGCDGCCGGKE